MITVRCRIYLAALWIAGPIVWASDATVVLSPHGFPPIDDRERTLDRVDWDDDRAGAVVLLEAHQADGASRDVLDRIFFRRVKVLTHAAAADQRVVELPLVGLDWELRDARARTVLGDGREIPAEVSRTRSPFGGEAVRVAFREVEPGAILDVLTFAQRRTSEASARASLSSFERQVYGSRGLRPPLSLSYGSVGEIGALVVTLQGDLPVLESRVVLIPPPYVSYEPLGYRLESDQLVPEQIRVPGQRLAYVWRFGELGALPRLPFLPPRDEVSSRLLIVPTADRAGLSALGGGWRAWAREQAQEWTEWLERGARRTRREARASAAGLDGVTRRVDTLRSALSEQVSVTSRSPVRTHRSPDAVLEAGNGTSADLAGVAIAMLRAVGLRADPVRVRCRGRELVPADFAVPALLDDVVVRVATGDGPQYFDPASDAPFGRLGAGCTRAVGLPLVRKVDTLVSIPGCAAEDNTVDRVAQLRLDPDGTLYGESVHLLHGAFAHRWLGVDTERVEAEVRAELGRWMPKVRLEQVELEHTGEEPDRSAVLRLRWSAAALADDLTLNPFLFERIHEEPWQADRREPPIDLGLPSRQSDRVRIELPSGIRVKALPESNLVRAGEAGQYRTEYTLDGDALVVTREVVLRQAWFPPEQYGGLRRWFTTMARADAQTVHLGRVEP